MSGHLWTPFQRKLEARFLRRDSVNSGTLLESLPSIQLRSYFLRGSP